MKDILKLFTVVELFVQSEKRKLYFLLFISIILGFLEISGIISVMPFMSIVNNPELIKENSILSYLYELGSFRSDNEFLVALGIAVIIWMGVVNIFSAIVAWYTFRIALMQGHWTTLRLYEKYIYQK